VIVIFLVLSAQFESFRDPFIIMMSVPLSIFGAMVPLNIGLASLNIYTQVGLITLVGLITKHGILMVEFANQLRHEQGYSRREAIVHAAEVRLRPILMTTAAMVLGTAPLLWASGAGAAARFSIGIVITSGMAVGTMFTLFVVPMFYTFISHPDAKPAPATDKGDGGGQGGQPAAPGRPTRIEPQLG
jgi:multidrug efflux pump